MTQQEALFNYLLRLGDNALVLSHRLSEWCSNAPFIEEDLALTNFALDMIGRAQAFLKYAGEIEGKGRTEDMLAYHRSEREYYNNQLAELPNGDFAYTMVRQLFLSAFEKYLFSSLMLSNDETIAAIAAKTLKEVKYHLEHASDWVVRLGDGTGESHYRAQKAVDELWMYTHEQFEMDEVDDMMARAGIGSYLKPLEELWSRCIAEVLERATLTIPAATYTAKGGRQGIHTEHLGHMLAEMQYLQRAYPDAKW